MSRLSLSLTSALGLLAWGAGCTKPNPASCLDNFCDDPTLPFCDADGSLEGTPNTCIAVDCTANEFVECRGDDAIVCNATSDNYLVAPCGALGCDAQTGCITETHECTPGEVRCGGRTLESCSADGTFTSEVCGASCVDGPTPHCAYLEPKYLPPDICDTPAVAASLFVPTFDTGTDTFCNGGIIAQDGGPELCIVRYGTIAIPVGSSARVTGPRALALVADDSLTIGGVLDISSGGAGVAGPSGDAYAGAGFVTPGGDAASTTVDGGGATGGSAVEPLIRTAFAGGYRARATSGMDLSFGGEGGGGALLVACRGSVRVSGTISAGGGGGSGGRPKIAVGQYFPGMGGGSGGYVVLQGLDVVIDGGLFANGGGGGNGNPSSSASGAPGGAGMLAAAPSAIGPRALDEGLGGAGGYLTVQPSFGTHPIGPAASTAGGGGGSVGAFQTYTPDGVVPTLTPTASSPKLSPPLTVPVR